MLVAQSIRDTRRYIVLYCAAYIIYSISAAVDVICFPCSLETDIYTIKLNRVHTSRIGFDTSEFIYIYRMCKFVPEICGFASVETSKTRRR